MAEAELRSGLQGRSVPPCHEDKQQQRQTADVMEASRRHNRRQSSSGDKAAATTKQQRPDKLATVSTFSATWAHTHSHERREGERGLHAATSVYHSQQTQQRIQGGQSSTQTVALSDQTTSDPEVTQRRRWECKGRTSGRTAAFIPAHLISGP
ncbi:hypothetical protein ABVT39_021922 [Epinephelus coioides]